MEILDILKDIGSRNNGDVYLGVVGPVRVGKSTFIKRFMEEVIIDNITSEEERKRTIDELPQSGSGKTITTIEPKFIPSSSIKVKINDSVSVNVRMIDCVGFVIDEATGYLEEGKMRMVKTPWFEESIPFDEAAKIGTEKVIKEHSTLGIVIVSDGSVTGFSRDSYIDAERKTIEKLISINKPFIILLNTSSPSNDETIKLKNDLEEKYNVPVIPLDIINMDREKAKEILSIALYQYPITSIEVALPKWVKELAPNHYINKSIQDTSKLAFSEIKKVKDVELLLNYFMKNEYIQEGKIVDVDTGSGKVIIQLVLNDGLFEQVLEEIIGTKISNKSELIKVLLNLSSSKRDLELIGPALKMAASTGYGFASSSLEDLNIEKPIQTKVQGRYGIKVKASTSTYHIIKVDVNSSFEPIMGSKDQADYFLSYLSKAYEEGKLSLLECEMFGRKFKDIINESITIKLNNLPEGVKIKLQQLIKTISNKGKGNLIAFVF